MYRFTMQSNDAIYEIKEIKDTFEAYAYFNKGLMPLGVRAILEMRQPDYLLGILGVPEWKEVARRGADIRSLTQSKEIRSVTYGVYTGE